MAFTAEDRRDTTATLRALMDQCEDALAELQRMAGNLRADDLDATQHSRAFLRMAMDEYEQARSSLECAILHLPTPPALVGAIFDQERVS